MLLVVEDISVLLQAKCHCTSGVGVCGRMWSGQYIMEYGSTPYTLYSDGTEKKSL